MYKKSARSIGTLISHGKHRQTHGKLRQTVEWLLSLTMKNLKRGRHLEYRKIHEQKKRGQSVSTVSGLTGRRKDHWKQWDNFPSQSWDFEYHWQGWTIVASANSSSKFKLVWKHQSWIAIQRVRTFLTINFHYFFSFLGLFSQLNQRTRFI